jgi:hypothetical protein
MAETAVPAYQRAAGTELKRRPSMAGTPDPALLDLYKLAVEMADRVYARRATANAFFLTVQTALIAVLATAAPPGSGTPAWQRGVACAAGVVIAACWWLQLRSYRDLARAKFGVINEIETQLPVTIYGSEWSALTNVQDHAGRKRYAEIGMLELVVPWVFAVLYVLLFVSQLVRPET